MPIVHIPRNYLVLITSVVVMALVVAAAARPEARQAKPAVAAAPVFKVDPSWPQDMPDHWIMGAVTGVFVDGRNHVWVAHLPETLTEEELNEEQKPPLGTCCKAAPPILNLEVVGEFGRGGRQLGQMLRPHGMSADSQGNLYVGEASTGRRVQKFTLQGRR